MMGALKQHYHEELCDRAARDAGENDPMQDPEFVKEYDEYLLQQAIERVRKERLSNVKSV